MSTEYQIVINSCPDQHIAQQLAEQLIDQQLAACVSIIPGITSVYRWQGKLASSQEQLLLIKTRRDQFGSVQQLICRYHPYELPEIVAVPIDQGLPDYLAWINSSLSDKQCEE